RFMRAARRSMRNARVSAISIVARVASVFAALAICRSTLSKTSSERLCGVARSQLENEQARTNAVTSKDVYTLSDLQNWRDASAGVEPPIRLSVFGDPVEHSKSPQMHNAALEKCGIAARYCRL